MLSVAVIVVESVMEIVWVASVVVSETVAVCVTMDEEVLVTLSVLVVVTSAVASVSVVRLVTVAVGFTVVWTVHVFSIKELQKAMAAFLTIGLVSRSQRSSRGHCVDLARTARGCHLAKIDCRVDGPTVGRERSCSRSSGTGEASARSATRESTRAEPRYILQIG